MKVCQALLQRSPCCEDFLKKSDGGLLRGKGSESAYEVLIVLESENFIRKFKIHSPLVRSTLPCDIFSSTTTSKSVHITSHGCLSFTAKVLIGHWRLFTWANNDIGYIWYSVSYRQPLKSFNSILEPNSLSKFRPEYVKEIFKCIHCKMQFLMSLLYGS